jgi:stage V sporulation protein R
MNNLIVTHGSDWTFDLIDEFYSHIEDIAVNEFGLDVYPNQIEIIGSEQMLDAYASVGMPIMYNHWSFGQSFLTQQAHYNRGLMGLAYEIVINSSPCIAYLMEENTIMMQALVMAHACFGHNAFFKGNYLFKQWTDAESIIDYLAFAKKYISECEDIYGPVEVERVLDACHALQLYGVDKYKRPPRLSVAEEEQRAKERREWQQSQLNEIWNTIPNSKSNEEDEEEKRFPESPHENILYFVEKNAPNLAPWKRELVRIVRKIAQYFYPQRQTQVMNEGFATFYHYQIMNRLYERGLVSDGFMLEFMQSHTNVVFQPEFDDPRYSGINPYALGFAMYKDIERVSMNPTDEDREWFGNQPWVGNGDWLKNTQTAMQNYKDESFILQYLSPKVIRDFKLFNILDDDRDPKIEVTAIHNKQGYRAIREALSRQYNIGHQIPDIQVYNVDRWGDRSITLRHNVVDRKPLYPENTRKVLQYLSYLWGYDVILQSVTTEDQIIAEYQIRDGETLLDVFELES